MKCAFLQENIPAKILLTRSRIFLYTDYIEKSIKVLSKIFGIVSFSSAWETSSKLDNLTSCVLRLIEGELTSTTSFALRVRRTGDHEYSSQDVAVQIGQAVCDRFHASVDLTTPDVELFIEIREDKAFLFKEKIEGVGGLPYASQGKICCYVRNKKDLLAGWFLMKRGCKIHFFSSEKLLITLTKKFLEKWFISKDSVSFIRSVYERKPEKYLKNEIEKCHCDGVCMGLTCQDEGVILIEKIKEFQKSFSLPVFTPLISMTDEECNQWMIRIGI